jgi:hypothetical protein
MNNKDEGEGIENVSEIEDEMETLSSIFEETLEDLDVLIKEIERHKTLVAYYEEFDVPIKTDMFFSEFRTKKDIQSLGLTSGTTIRYCDLVEKITDWFIEKKRHRDGLMIPDSEFADDFGLINEEQYTLPEILGTLKHVIN